MGELVVLGHGNTADVYEWDADRVLKLFKPGFEGNAEKEFRVTREINKTELRTTKARSVVHVNDRVGIIYDRVYGTEMYAEMIKRTKDMKMWGELFAEIHYQIHSFSVPSLSSPGEELNTLIENCSVLSIKTREQILTIFNGLTDDGRTVLCHFDFHPLNVIMSDGVPFIIDWINSRSFHPLADVALSSVIFQVVKEFPGWINEFHELYVQRYLQLSSYDVGSLIRWQIPMAVARLSENKESERKGILEMIEKNIRLVTS